MIADALREHPDKKIFLVFPDDNAAKRAEGPPDDNPEDPSGAIAFVSRKYDLDMPFVYCTKRRISSRSSKTMQVLGDPDLLAQMPGNMVIEVDDELATGGTLDASCKILKEKFGAAVAWSIVTHPVLCGSSHELLSGANCAIDRVYCSDTIPFEHRPEFYPMIESGFLRVDSWLDDLAKICYFNHWNENIRELR
ncbi:MAG: hypothetical protein ABIH21_02260 [Patescibacteria group bacterium]